MPANKLQVHPSWQLPLDEIDWQGVRSSGPGGQNVNKVNSKVEIRFNVLSSASLPERLRARIIEQAGSRISAAGDVIVVAGRFRDQPRNREDGIERLVKLLQAWLYVPPKRRATRPTRSSKERRHEHKREQSSKKSSRKLASTFKRSDGDRD